jgi:hypothetical protein
MPVQGTTLPGHALDHHADAHSTWERVRMYNEEKSSVDCALRRGHYPPEHTGTDFFGHGGIRSKQ